MNKLINEIQVEMRDFYNLEVSKEVIQDFIKWYFKGKWRKNIVFDTVEREDLLYYLEELGLVKLKRS
jgi:hypothetical protein